MTNLSLLKTRFFENVAPQDKEECWLWQGSKTGNGYGKVMIDRVNFLAHRLSWIVFKEKTIPRNLCVMHKCDNPPCVNPRHLILGTTKDNAVDRSVKNRGYRPIGELHHMAKLKENDVFKIRALKKNTTLTNEVIAKKFGIQPRQVRRIASGYSWAHTPFTKFVKTMNSKS